MQSGTISGTHLRDRRDETKERELRGGLWDSELEPSARIDALVREETPQREIEAEHDGGEQPHCLISTDHREATKFGVGAPEEQSQSAAISDHQWS